MSDITMDVNKPGTKERKPYKLTKQRESWSVEEHNRFQEALQLYNRNWKKIEVHIGTKSVVQIRSHAQKFFQKVLKNGGTDVAIPPPRPKSSRPHRFSSSAATANNNSTGGGANAEDDGGADGVDTDVPAHVHKASRSTCSTSGVSSVGACTAMLHTAGSSGASLLTTTAHDPSSSSGALCHSPLTSLLMKRAGGAAVAAGASGGGGAAASGASRFSHLARMDRMQSAPGSFGGSFAPAAADSLAPSESLADSRGGMAPAGLPNGLLNDSLHIFAHTLVQPSQQQQQQQQFGMMQSNVSPSPVLPPLVPNPTEASLLMSSSLPQQLPHLISYQVSLPLRPHQQPLLQQQLQQPQQPQQQHLFGLHSGSAYNPMQLQVSAALLQPQQQQQQQEQQWQDGAAPAPLTPLMKDLVSAAHLHRVSAEDTAMGTNDSDRQASQTEQAPDMRVVYTFLGSLFDPQFEECNYVQALENMTASDRETAIAMMGGVAQQMVTSCTAGSPPLPQPPQPQQHPLLLAAPIAHQPLPPSWPSAPQCVECTENVGSGGGSNEPDGQDEVPSRRFDQSQDGRSRRPSPDEVGCGGNNLLQPFAASHNHHDNNNAAAADADSCAPLPQLCNSEADDQWAAAAAAGRDTGGGTARSSRRSAQLHQQQLRAPLAELTAPASPDSSCLQHGDAGGSEEDASWMDGTGDVTGGGGGGAAATASAPSAAAAAPGRWSVAHARVKVEVLKASVGGAQEVRCGLLSATPAVATDCAEDDLLPSNFMAGRVIDLDAQLLK